MVSGLLVRRLSRTLGSWGAASRPRDDRAWARLGILIGISQITRNGLFDPLGWPKPLGIVSLIFRSTAIPLWAIAMGFFGIYFPHRWRFDQRLPWLKWLLLFLVAAPGLVGIIHDALASFDFAAASSLGRNPLGDKGTFAINSMLCSFFFIGISTKYHDPDLAADDRRRLRILYTGCSVAMTPLFFLLIGNLILGKEIPDALFTVAMMAVTLFPLTIAYVVVVERAFEVRVVFRRGVEYAVARGGSWGS